MASVWPADLDRGFVLRQLFDEGLYVKFLMMVAWSLLCVTHLLHEMDLPALV